MVGQRNEGEVMENEFEEQMMRLLQVINERQAKGKTHTEVFPHEVAHEAGLDPESSDYQEMLDELCVRGYMHETYTSGGYWMTDGGLVRLAEED